MKTYEQCLKCFERQAADACAMAALAADDTDRLLAAVREKIVSFPRNHCPVEMAVEIHKLVRSISGIDDPYRAVKRISNNICRSCLPMLSDYMALASDPMATAVSLAIAGNIIDYGACSTAPSSQSALARIINDTLAQPIVGSPLSQFKAVVAEAKTILFIGDNAGECFFDRSLLKQLPHEKVTYAVRGGPILNDATRWDAATAGIDQICPLIDTGDRTPGVILERCSEEFRTTFEKSDLVIAKGQGNYESLGGRQDRTYVFITKVKCAVIARDIGYPEGSNVLQIAPVHAPRATNTSKRTTQTKTMEVSYA